MKFERSPYRRYWLENPDPEFTTSDLVMVFQAGEYEDSLVGNSNWSDGDWNGDGEFTSSDLVLAFGAGGYEASATSSATFVPEPRSMGMLVGMLMLLRLHKRRTRKVTGE
ncbi:MAG: hypothetical protein KDA87_22630 [Planctomycetales bacterium]|nr:hypothetical protein [Planctomycetales bacterium]